MRTWLFYFWLGVIVVVDPVTRHAWPYDIGTHRGLAVKGVAVSSLDQVLKIDLGFQEGKEEKFGGKSAEEWIRDGAGSEDDFPRFFNHFHDPLYQADGTGRGPWSQAGLFGTFQSSVLWGQNPNQAFGLLGGSWSWQNARQSYLDALIGQTPTKREQAFADTFRALGQLSHLIQDASVPAHVRNDAHASLDVPFFGKVGNPDWYEDWVEKTRVNNSPLFQSLLNRDPIRPSFSIFTPTGNTQAPVPIARLMDTDKFLGLNFSVLTDPDLGLTEYTNGNFLSRDTMFKDFDLPRQSSLDPIFLLEPFNGKFRRYFEKLSEGETVTHFVTEGTLYAALKEALNGGLVPAGGWTLDDRVDQDYAALLLPRAVGYSAALLDYFFRGKLDVDLLPDANNPSVVHLSGTNGSPDKLDGGALTLYADDPVTGERSPVTALQSDFAVTADPGQPVESAKFQITAGAERFMAVYKGRLGNEAPQGDFPGGVIGKALGGVRAELISPNGDKRELRTVDGIFDLPSTTDRLRAVQWGDEDNTFVGNLSSATGGPDELLNFPDQGILAFKINRAAGSPDVPLVGGTNTVSADMIKTLNFPIGLPLGVTVNYSLSIQFKELLATYETRTTSQWNGAYYTFVSSQIIDPTGAETPVDQTLTFTESFPLVLDSAHRPGGSAFTPYWWSVDEVALDRQGRVLALVRVTLTRPTDSRRTLSLYQYDTTCQQLAADPSLPQAINASFPATDTIWAVVDVEKQQVLGVSASPTVTFSTQAATSTLLVQQRVTNVYSGGGPSDGTYKSCVDARVSLPLPNPSFLPVNMVTITRPVGGTLSQSLTGRFREDIDPLVSSASGMSTQTIESSLVYAVDSANQVNRAIDLLSPLSGITGTFTFAPQAKLMRPTPGDFPEVVLLFPQVQCQAGRCFGEWAAVLARWSPQFPSNTALALTDKLPSSGRYSLIAATAQTALIEFEDLGIFWLSDWIADFANNNLRTIRGTPPIVLSRQYVLLDPTFLYSINDTKFHTLDSSLRVTVLPRALASAPATSPRDGAYHLIRLQ